MNLATLVQIHDIEEIFQVTKNLVRRFRGVPDFCLKNEEIESYLLKEREDEIWDGFVKIVVITYFSRYD